MALRLDIPSTENPIIFNYPDSVFYITSQKNYNVAPVEFAANCDAAADNMMSCFICF